MRRSIDPARDFVTEDEDTEPSAPKGVVIVRTFRRDPDWDGWSFEPEIIFDRPIDVLDLLRDDEDAP